MRFNFQSFVLLAFIVSLFACSSGDTEEFRTAVFVNDLDIVSIDIPLTDTQSRLHVTDNRQFDLSVLATLGDGSTQTVSRFLQWSSSAPEVISVNGAGVATALTEGESTITVRLGEFSDEVEMTSSDAQLESIEVISTAITVPVCSFEQTLTVRGTYDDATVGDVAFDRVSWASSPETVAKVQSVDEVPTILALASGDVTLTATVELPDAPDITDNLALTIDDSTLTSIAITPNPASIAEGLSLSFVARATYSDLSAPNNTRDITRAAVWTPLSPTFLEGTSTPGRFTAVQEGSATIRASCGGQHAEASVTITEPRRVTGIEIRDSNGVPQEDILPKRPNSGDFKLEAWLIYNNGDREPIPDDDEDLEWRITEGSSSVLTVDNSLGNKGFVDLQGFNVGEVELEVRYRISDTQRFDDTITIEVAVDN